MAAKESRLSNDSREEDKSTHNSTNKAGFPTKIMHFCDNNSNHNNAVKITVGSSYKLNISYLHYIAQKFPLTGV